MKLFITGFFQVIFITINTFFVSKLYYIGIAGASFMISYIWCFNVSKISKGNKIDAFVYSLGASTGGITGAYIAQTIFNNLG